MMWLICAAVVGCLPEPAPPPDSPTDAQPKPAEDSRPQAVPKEGSVQISEHVSYVLDDGERQHEEFPDSFWIPPAEQRNSLQKDQIVKLLFRITANGETQTERMWVVVEKKTDDGYLGLLDNDPYCTAEIQAGLKVPFQPRHVIQIYGDDDESQ